MPETNGTYVSGQRLLALMGGATGLVVRIRWCTHESIAEYRALFHGVPAPDALVSDGMRGMERTARAEWSSTRLQRRLAHVHRDTKRDLTHKPKNQTTEELRNRPLGPERRGAQFGVVSVDQIVLRGLQFPHRSRADPVTQHVGTGIRYGSASTGPLARVPSRNGSGCDESDHPRQ